MTFNKEIKIHLVSKF